MTVSPRQSFLSLPEAQRLSLLHGLTDEQRAHLAYKWAGWHARPDQLPPPGDWRFWVVLAGRGWGKTRVGAEWTRENVKTFQYVNLVAPTADDARDVMIEGESGILAICPPWERPDYQPSKRKLAWPNGATSLIFTADEPERLRGKQHERLWADELAAWRYPEAWDQILLGLRLGVDPRAVVTTTPKPTRIIRDLVRDPNAAVTRGTTYDNLENLAPAFAEQIIAKYEGTRLGRQELHAELLEDEGLAYRFSELVHVVPRFVVPAHWERFESMDFGSNNPTAWLAWAIDEDSNLVVFDEYYSPGFPSEHAPEIWKRREWWWAKDERGEPIAVPCFADPSIRNKAPTSIRTSSGRQLSVEAEFNDYGISFAHAQNDRRAGYVRLAELLREDPNRTPPAWGRRGTVGAPQLYVMDHCKHLIEQFKDAPIEDERGRFPSEAVDGSWESANGHAHAAARYGGMSRPLRTDPVPVEPDDPREALFQRILEGEESRSQRTAFVN